MTSHVPPCYLLWVMIRTTSLPVIACVVLSACSSRDHEFIERGTADEESIAPTTAGDSGGTHVGGSAAPTLTHDNSAAAGGGISAPDGGTGTAPNEEACPFLSVSLRFDTLGATQFDARYFFEEGPSTGRTIDAEVIWTPGTGPDPDDRSPPIPDEAEWDRSPTPLASCTIVFKDLPVDCYDLTSSSLTVVTPEDRRVVFNNVRDPNAFPQFGCETQPGCPHAFVNAPNTWYYILPEEQDARMVICGMKCDEIGNGEGSFSLVDATQTQTCNN